MTLSKLFALIFGLFVLVAFILLINTQLTYLSKKSHHTPLSSGALKITSDDFLDGTNIPRKYTCDGKNVNPPLRINGVSEKAKSLILLVDDPDAKPKPWSHWVLYDIDPKTSEIRENSTTAGSLQGYNDFGKHEYDGPCPPSGVHHYVFTVYVLDNELNRYESFTKDSIEEQIKGHVLTQAQLTGIYKR